MDKENQSDIVRLLKWIGNNQDMWLRIYDEHRLGEISKEEFIEIKNELIKESFFEVLLVFVSVYQSEKHVEEYMRSIMLNMIAEEFDHDDGKRFIELLQKDV